MKRLFLIFLVLGLMLTLCACGAAGGESDGASAPDAEEALEATEAPPPDSVGVYLGTGGGIARYRPLTDSELTGDISPAGLLFPEDRDVALPVYGNPYPVGKAPLSMTLQKRCRRPWSSGCFLSWSCSWGITIRKNTLSPMRKPKTMPPAAP